MDHRTKKLLSPWRRNTPGQALIEYALILTLVAMALMAALIMTGPAIANVFSNTVCNLVGLEDCSPASIADRGGSPNDFWATVTEVAKKPPKEQPNPLNPPVPEKTIDPNMPTPTWTPVTPSATPQPTKTDTLTPTPKDQEFGMPHLDAINTPAWWRVDSSVYLGGADWWGEYFPNKTLSGPAEPAAKPPRTKGGIWNYQIDLKYKFNINFDWGDGAPLGGWQTDNFSARWTRDVTVAGTDNVDVSITLTSIGGVRLFIDGTKLTPDSAWTETRKLSDAPVVVTTTLTPGEHKVVLEYFTGTGAAAVFMDMSQYKGNVPDDANLASGSPKCQWTRITGSQPNTEAWAWKESAGTKETDVGFPANMKCHLELRGSVLISTEPNKVPRFSFWDVWDLTGGGSVTLQMAEYKTPGYNYVNKELDLASIPDWATGTTIPLHSGGTKNYAWTRSIIDIPDKYYGKRLAFRFVIDSSSPTAGNRRWYLDDIMIANMDKTEQTFGVCSVNLFSCGNYWSLDQDAQKSEFITTGRWAITPNKGINGTSGYDASGGSAYVRFGPEQPKSTGAGDYRIHAVEFNGNFVFSGINPDGTGGDPDYEGNSGVPILRFYQAYNIESGTALEIQYTTDARDEKPDNWQTVQLLATGAANKTTLEQIEVDLSGIPNWWSTPILRLRFAMKVDGSRTPTTPGWWIDDIVIVRKGVPKFSNYPFCDGADKAGMVNWLSGNWGLAEPGLYGTALAFTDSPNGMKYTPNSDTWMELRYPIDFADDTPENKVGGGNKDCEFGNAGGAAKQPILSFWHWRDVASGATIAVDIRRSGNTASGTAKIDWTPVWTYTYKSNNGVNKAWEYVEVNLEAAILSVIKSRTGLTTTWSDLNGTNQPSNYDDDFYFRIRLYGGSGTADGVYVDKIEVRNYADTSFKFWDIPLGGNGSSYNEYVEAPTAPDQWWTRWRTGGDWGVTDTSTWVDLADQPPAWWKAHNSISAFHDSSPTSVSDPYDKPYRTQTASVLEMTKVIDLSKTAVDDQPVLTFWNHYNLGNNHGILVQVAVEDKALTDCLAAGGNNCGTVSTRNRMGYDYIYGWGTDLSYNPTDPKYAPSSWEPPIWAKASGTRVDTWVFEKVDLSAYIGKRIRIRFIMNGLSTSTPRDGWYLDDIAVEQNKLAVKPFPFSEIPKNTVNWITEGLWGLTPDVWRGSGGSPAGFGSDRWNNYFVKCLSGGAITNCSSSAADNTLKAVQPTKAAMQTYVNANIAANKALPMYDSDALNFNFGSTDRPPQAPTDASWLDNFAMRSIRIITVQTGEYNFIVRADDGVRLRYESTAGPEDLTSPYTWNIFARWSTGTSINYVPVTLAAGDYKLVLEYFENGGNANISVQAGTTNFSFTDSPAVGTTAADRRAYIPYGNSSLMLKGVLNLTRPTGLTVAQWNPQLSYYTTYDLRDNAVARVEISWDGGFTWSQNHLNENCPSGQTCDPTIWGYTQRLPYGSEASDWQLRIHDLRYYPNVVGSNYLGLRFRLQTQQNDDGGDGWWLTDILADNAS